MFAKYGKKALIGLGVIFLLLQFIRPAKNISGDNTHALATRYAVPAEVDKILTVACNDCHSNTTHYPWYAHIQPVGLWLDQHVNEGKRHLNFSEFTKRKVAVQNHKFEELIEMVQDKHMPLGSYTWIHRDAILSDAQRKVLIDWAQMHMDSLKAQYPADSLVLRRKG
jgi:hypothetical protein